MSLPRLKELPPELLDLEAIRAEKARRKLREFVKAAWHVVEPGTEFVPGWHLDAICEHLEAVSRGEIRNLLINMPPRHMKSLAVAVFWPCWEWIDKPVTRWLFSSYAATLSTRDSLKCRRLIQSPWYQRHFGDRFQLTGDQNVKNRFENDKTGYRIATSVGGSGTGEGGDRIVVDDPHNMGEIHSVPIRTEALTWWDETMSTRGNDPKTVAKVIVMQRGHFGDLSGHVLEKGGYDHLCLPAEYEGKKIITSIGWSDPRKETGELLWPERFGTKEMQELKLGLGSDFAIAGQLQQRPTALSGGIIKAEYWRKWPHKEAPHCLYILQSWDTAFGEDQENDYSARTTWGIFEAETEHGLRACMILLERWKDRVGFPVLRKLAKESYIEWQPDKVLIEKKASGQSLIQEMRKAGVPVQGWNPDKYGSKYMRTHAASVVWEQGCVYYPDKPWAQEVIDECAAFPKGEHDDVHDTCMQAALWLRRTYHLQLLDEDDEDEDLPQKSQNRGLYGKRQG